MLGVNPNLLISTIENPSRGLYIHSLKGLRSNEVFEGNFVGEFLTRKRN